MLCSRRDYSPRWKGDRKSEITLWLAEKNSRYFNRTSILRSKKRRRRRRRKKRKKWRRNDKTNYKFVFNGEKTELFNRDCSLLMDEKKICVYIYTHTHTYACNSVRERRSFVTRINCRNHRSFYKISKPFFIPNITIPTASLSLSLSRIIHKLIDFLRYKSSIGTYLFPPVQHWMANSIFPPFFFFFLLFFFFPRYLALPVVNATSRSVFSNRSFHRYNNPRNGRFNLYTRCFSFQFIIGCMKRDTGHVEYVPCEWKNSSIWRDRVNFAQGDQ